MRHQQIVTTLRRIPHGDIVMQPLDIRRSLSKNIFNALPRQLQHPCARINAIDLDPRMSSQQFAEEAPIPLPYDQRAPWRRHLIKQRNSTTLERSSKRNRFQRPIPRRQRIEAHAFKMPRPAAG